MIKEVYELIKDIEHPLFTGTIKASEKKVYSEQQLKSSFGINHNSARFKEFFKVSEKYQLHNCMIVQKPKKDVVTLIQEQVAGHLEMGRKPTTVILHEDDVLKLKTAAAHWFSVDVPLTLSEDSVAAITILGRKLDVVEAIRGIKKGEVYVF